MVAFLIKKSTSVRSKVNSLGLELSSACFKKCLKLNADEHETSFYALKKDKKEFFLLFEVCSWLLCDAVASMSARAIAAFFGIIATGLAKTQCDEFLSCELAASTVENAVRCVFVLSVRGFDKRKRSAVRFCLARSRLRQAKTQCGAFLACACVTSSTTVW
jgi:hypothetical protein